MAKHISMWSKNFQLKEMKNNKPKSPKKEKQLPSRTPTTRGQVAVMKTDTLKNQLTPKKRTLEGKILDQYFVFIF